jgi:hypothetical protein
MVAVLILTFVLVMGAAATNYAVANLRSAKTSQLNESLRNAFDIISQKMNTANDKITTSPAVYGFKDIGGILVIVHKVSATAKQCTYIGRNGTVLKMVQVNPCTTVSASLTDGQAITPDEINVTGFTLDGHYMTTPGLPDHIPYITINIQAQDTNDPTNTIEIKTAFALDYQTVNNLQ